MDVELVAAASPTIGALAAFALCAVTTPLGLDRIVLCTLVLLVGSARVAGGRAAGALTALMGGFAFDFFHVSPLRVLHVRTLAEALVLLLAVALVRPSTGACTSG